MSIASVCHFMGGWDLATYMRQPEPFIKAIHVYAERLMKENKK